MSLIVEDNGPSVSDAEKDKIFDRFHRVLDNRKSASEQSGSGLAIVKEIASLHGATISISDSATPSGLKVMLGFKRLAT